MQGLALYPLLLGELWAKLPEPVRRCHDAAPRLVAEGRFIVTHARSWLARIVIALARMPRARDGVRLRLEVNALADHLVWRRDFDEFTMLTTQRLRPDGRMAERRGPMELLFEVAGEADAIVYRPRGVRLCLGALRIPMPSWLAPRVEGRAWTVSGEACMHVHIVIAAPILGTLVTYGGPLVPKTDDR